MDSSKFTAITVHLFPDSNVSLQQLENTDLSLVEALPLELKVKLLESIPVYSDRLKLRLISKNWLESVNSLSKKMSMEHILPKPNGRLSDDTLELVHVLGQTYGSLGILQIKDLTKSLEKFRKLPIFIAEIILDSGISSTSFPNMLRWSWCTQLVNLSLVGPCLENILPEQIHGVLNLASLQSLSILSEGLDQASKIDVFEPEQYPNHSATLKKFLTALECPSLKKIELNIQNVVDTGIGRFLMRYGKDIKVLKILGTTYVDSTLGIQFMRTLRHLVGLEELNLEFWKSAFIEPLMHEEFLDSIFSRFKTLKKFGYKSICQCSSSDGYVFCFPLLYNCGSTLESIEINSPFTSLCWLYPHPCQNLNEVDVKIKRISLHQIIINGTCWESLMKLKICFLQDSNPNKRSRNNNTPETSDELEKGICQIAPNLKWLHVEFNNSNSSIWLTCSSLKQMIASLHHLEKITLVYPSKEDEDDIASSSVLISNLKAFGNLYEGITGKAKELTNEKNLKLFMYEIDVNRKIIVKGVNWVFRKTCQLPKARKFSKV